jgi:hypothetical protein
MHAPYAPRHSGGQSPHRTRPRFRNGQRAAALQAIVAARLWRGVTADTQAKAANMCGVCLTYVIAAAIVLDGGDTELVADVLAGRVPLLKAAAHVKKRTRLLRAYYEASTR